LGCAAAYLVSLLFSQHSIMTEKLARRDSGVRQEYAADYLSHVLVRQAATRDVVSLKAEQQLGDTRNWLIDGMTHGGDAAHEAFPVVNEEGLLVGMLTRRDVLSSKSSHDVEIRTLITRTPAVVFDDNTLRDAADHMVLEDVGRLPVVTRENPRHVVGMLSRGDLVGAHAQRLSAALDLQRGVAGRA
jgi:CBS domain-containing protein